MEAIRLINPFALLLALLAALIMSTSETTGQQIDVYSRPVQMERSHDFDALHYLTEITFDFDKQIFKGSNKVTVRALRNGFNECILDAGDNITIMEVVDLHGNQLNYKREEGKVAITFPKAVNYNDTLVFKLIYSGVNPAGSDDRKIFYEKTADNPRMVWCPNFPNRVRNWMPCYDFPNDKATNEMIIHVRDGLKAVSNGRLVNVKEDKKTGYTTWHWHQGLPHSTYLFVLAIAPYVVFEDSLGNLPVNYWVFPQDSVYARVAFSRTPQIIKFYNELFDFEYPWEKCDQVAVPTMGGAAESTTATLYSHSVLTNLDQKALKDYSFDRIIAHETAHHWWGDLITLRTWSETWLNESFGTYSDYLYTRSLKGEDEGALDLEGKKNAYLTEAHEKYMRPIVFSRYEEESPGQNFDRHTYQKGALMMHLLRSMLGDDLFFRTISYFLHKHAFKPVDTHDFMIAVKEVTGLNMDWFFEQFFYKPGHPVFEVTTNWNEVDMKLSLNIRQVQDTVHGIPYAYRIPVKIGFYTSSGKTVEELWLTRREESFDFSLPGKPEMVKFDDDNTLLKEVTFNKSTDELLYQLENDDVIGRALAATELASHQDKKRILPALERSATTDQFWNARKSALESLEKINPGKLDKLCRKMASDPHSQVRAATIRLLGRYKNPAAVPFLKERFRKDDSYLVQAECINSIASCGSAKDIDFLREAGKIASPRNVIARAAERALDKLDSTNE